MNLISWAATRLKELGWSLPDEAAVQTALQAALAAYQAWHGLEASGELDPATQRHLALPRFCRHPDVMQLTLEQQSRRTPATWAWAGPSLPGLADGAVEKAVQAAFDAWTAVADCLAVRMPPPGNADILIATGPIDGPYGVLGETELPGPVPQHMTLDADERWVIQLGTLQGMSQIDLERVLTHELGHFWGMGHIASGNLMAPIYSPSIDRPQPGDIAEMRRRYGPPAGGSPPPPPGGSNKVTIEIYDAARINIPGYKITPVA